MRGFVPVDYPQNQPLVMPFALDMPSGMPQALNCGSIQSLFRVPEPTPGLFENALTQTWLLALV